MTEQESIERHRVATEAWLEKRSPCYGRKRK
jgi:hypothetical protein